MTFSQKLALAKAIRLALAVVLVAILADGLRAISYHYCHGASHNAHGWYCQAVYQDDYTAL